MAKKIPLDGDEIPELKKTVTKKPIEKAKTKDKPNTFKEKLKNFWENNPITCILLPIFIIWIIVSFAKYCINEDNLEKAREARKANNSISEKYEEPEYIGTLFGIKEMKLSDVKDYFKDQTIAVLVGREDCEYTVEFVPTVIEVADEYHAILRIVDYSKLQNYKTGEVVNQEEYDLFNSYIVGTSGTPTLFFFKNGKKVNNEVLGVISKEKLEAKFQSAGFKKK